MKNIVRSITAAILFSTIHVTSVSAGPFNQYNQYQNLLEQNNIDTYTWLYWEALEGNEIAKRNLKFLERIYGPDLVVLAKNAAAEKWGIEMAELQAD